VHRTHERVTITKNGRSYLVQMTDLMAARRERGA
jgi:hypothetical protein